MTDREKLIDLIVSADISLFGTGKPYAEVYADYLLENGVVVLPCNVDDTVYLTKNVWNTLHTIPQKAKVSSFYYDTENNEINFHCVFGRERAISNFGIADIGETVFLTKEEAEKALAERAKL